MTEHASGQVETLCKWTPVASLSEQNIIDGKIVSGTNARELNICSRLLYNIRSRDWLSVNKKEEKTCMEW